MHNDKPNPAKIAYDWQKERRRDDGSFSLPVQGFGMPDGLAPVEGGMTLWLPNPTVESRIVVREGKVSRQVDQGILSRPEIAELRDEVLSSMTRRGRDLIEVDLRLIEYTAAVILINYRLGDDDLSQLLSADGYHSPMIRHLMGGQGAVEALIGMKPQMDRPPVDLTQKPAPMTTPEPEPVRPSAAHRVWSFFRGMIPAKKGADIS